MRNLHNIYYQKKGYCCKCGCQLTTDCGVPLGSIFCMDRNGLYYCINCDKNLDANGIYEEEDKNNE